MSWKVSGLFLCVSCVLLCAVILLWQQNGDLKERNNTLQRTLQINIEAAKKKAERDKDELERLSKELAVMEQFDPAWTDTPLPATIAKQLRRLIKDHNSTISAATRTENSLQK